MKVTLLAIAITLCCPLLPFAQEAPATAASIPVVVTHGEALITAMPDRAFVTIAAESRSRISADAQRMNAEAMTAVMSKLTQAGIVKEAVRTIAYDLQPEFDYANGRQTLRGYVARNTIEVRVDAVDRLGAVLDAAGAGGATSISGVRFDVRAREMLERDALRQAVADARARAEAAAAGAGRTIDRVMKIEEDAGPPEVIRPMMRMAAAEQAPQTPVSPAAVEIRSRVTLTAALK